MNHSICCNISTRWASTRFPQKAIHKINGIPLTVHVANVCEKVVGRQNVIIMYDDIRIYDALADYGYKMYQTPVDGIKNSSERAAYGCSFHDYDYIIDVQNDEPLISEYDIVKVRNHLIRTNEITQAFAYTKDQEVINNKNVIKMVAKTDILNSMSKSRQLLYASRAPIPYGKNGILQKAMKQVCIYGYHREDLIPLYGNGKETRLERAESIHILRAVECCYPVHLVEVSGHGQAVDCIEDVAIVERLMNERSN